MGTDERWEGPTVGRRSARGDRDGAGGSGQEDRPQDSWQEDIHDSEQDGSDEGGEDGEDDEDGWGGHGDTPNRAKDGSCRHRRGFQAVRDADDAPDEGTAYQHEEEEAAAAAHKDGGVQVTTAETIAAADDALFLLLPIPKIRK